MKYNFVNMQIIDEEQFNGKSKILIYKIELARLRWIRDKTQDLKNVNWSWTRPILSLS